MKQSDIFSVIIIATVGTLVAFFITNSLLGDPNMQSVTFKTMNDITPTLLEPDVEIFNPDAINPTVEVFVGDCEDIDQNGILSEDELVTCGKTDEETNENTSDDVQKVESE